MCMRRACAVFALLLIWAVAGWAVAQEPAGPAPSIDEPVVQKLSPTQIVETGGWLMYVLALMSVLALAFVLFFFFALRLGQVAPPALKTELVGKLKSGSLDEARTLCGFRPSPLSSITRAAIDYAQSVKKAEPGLLKDVVEAEGGRQSAVLQGRTQYLLDVAVIAPMVGLLGTVFGMFQAFNTVAHDLAKANPMILAEGVSKALITTAAGLMVGIPSMMFYAYFRGRASRLVAELESAATEVLTSLTGEQSDELPGQVQT